MRHGKHMELDKKNRSCNVRVVACVEVKVKN